MVHIDDDRTKERGFCCFVCICVLINAWFPVFIFCQDSTQIEHRHVVEAALMRMCWVSFCMHTSMYEIKIYMDEISMPNKKTKLFSSHP